MGASLKDEHVANPQESNASEGEVTPLVLRPDKSTNESSDNHDLVDENGPKDGGPWHASGEEEVKKEERSGDSPDTVNS